MSTEKILSFSEAVKLAGELKARGKKIVYAQGYFDLLHAGHVRHFEEAKKLGDVLMVGVVVDQFVNKGPGRPIFKEEQRLNLVAALTDVDFAFLNKTPDAVEAIRKIVPQVYVKGEDVRQKANDPRENLYREIKELKAAGGKIHFTKSLPIHSTDLLNKFSNFKQKKKK